MDHGALLNTLLHELKDGVVVCDPDARIILFNGAAEALFGPRQLGGRTTSLYNLCLEAPVAHALNLLHYLHARQNQSGPPPYVQFMNSSLDQEKHYRCRVSLLPPVADTKNSFVIIFEDISAWYSPENPLFLKIEEFRAPMTNLRAAVENLTEYPEMSPVMRSAFENVLVQESLNLTEAFDSLARSCKVLMQTQNHLTALHTDVLFGYVTKHLHKQNISVTASPEQSISVKVDMYGLLLVLDYLVAWIRKMHRRTRLACAAHVGEQFVYFDLNWPAEYIATGALKAMLEEKLENTVGRMTIASILHSMDGDIWSQQREKKKSILRLALPIAVQAER